MNENKMVVCPYSQEKFIQRRPNQIYANRKAQIKAGNNRAREKRLDKNYSQKKLDRNREIIKNLLEGKTSMIVNIEYLNGAGLDGCFFTNFKIIDKVKQITEFYVFDYGFQKIDSEKIRIFKIPKNE